METRGERLQGITQGKNSTSRLASLSPASFPRRNKCPWTQCNPIVQKKEKTAPARSAREFEIKGKTEERTQWQLLSEKEKRREMADLLLLQESCKMAQVSAEKLEHDGSAEIERVAPVPQRSTWKGR